MKPTKFNGVFESRSGKKRVLLTQNLLPGKKVYFEKLFKQNNQEYREWDPKRSKLAAAILKGINDIGIKKNDLVLYLGASTGTTVSHVSDIVGKDGFIFALDFAPRVMRQLVYLCMDRTNVTPILADANQPETYLNKTSLVDVVYMDIAQKGQSGIFLKNIDQYLKKDGYALLAVKARSIDVSKKPSQIFNQVRSELQNKVKIIDYKTLDPFEKDHCMFICKKI